MIKGRFQQNKDGSFVGYVEVLRANGDSEPEQFRCRLIPEDPEMGFGMLFAALVMDE